MSEAEELPDEVPTAAPSKPVVPGEPVVADQGELERIRAGLGLGPTGHLLRLVASWNLLADFCFSDLLLFVPADQEAHRFAVWGQVRPSTGQTLYRADLVGQIVDDDERPLIARSFRLGEIIEGEITIAAIRERVRVLCIPIRFQGEVIGVLSREAVPSVARQTGDLERAYVDIFNRLARMIASGDFPFAAVDSESDESPRVGDGVLTLDRGARVEYASPNAVSALHRVGVHANAEGMRLGELGLDDDVIRTAFSEAAPTSNEFERGRDVTMLLRCIPLLDHGRVTGAVVLVRDISELRRRDRLLLSKDATIREIHHRVKNNLQTISSLLRLQGRRSGSPEAKAAIEESVRRISSIAVVHETLSKEAGEDVPFVDIVRPLVRMVEDGLLAPERQVRFVVDGDAGTLPADVATPLSVVITELLQNTVDHAFPDGASGEVHISLADEHGELVVRVADTGVGLPEGFDIGQAGGLGLTIVRALVTSDLAGTITATSPPGRTGTVVEVRVPTHVARSA
ncbi:MAG TPA: histidine kinase N-terminal domain-containing protein [Acidimicrobiales bacterium]|nr:histidine kinase N-terminal domain-containing protein [Acidimicrobiales bacterium]